KEDVDRHRDGHDGDQPGQSSHRAGKVTLVLAKGDGAGLEVGELDGLARVLALDVEMEQQADVEREEEVDDEHKAEQQAGRVDGGGDHQQQAEDDQLRVVAVGALLEEFDQLQEDQELPDDEDRRGGRVQHQVGDVDE